MSVGGAGVWDISHKIVLRMPNPTQAIGKLHHTLEAETLVAKSLLTEFFNKLMRVHRKHDIVQAKLKKERQQGK